MNSKNFDLDLSFLDETTVESVSLSEGVYNVQIVNCSVYRDRILINVISEQGLPVTQVASFNCGTPNGKELAKQFFGSLVGANVKLGAALGLAVGKVCKAKITRNNGYVLVTMKVLNSYRKKPRLVANQPRFLILK